MSGQQSYPNDLLSPSRPGLTYRYSTTSTTPPSRNQSPSSHGIWASASHDPLLGGHSDENGTPALGSTAPGSARVFTTPVPVENPQLATDITLHEFKAHQKTQDDPELDFRPTILKGRWLFSAAIFYLTIAAVIMILWWRSGSDRQFHLSSENVRMISRYFPSLVGTATTLLFRHTIREFIRMTPYINMADQRGKPKGEKPKRSVCGAFFPWQNITVTRGFMSIFSLLCSFIASLIVSLKVALLASSNVNNEWLLTVRFYPAFFLVVGHFFMAVYTFFVWWRLHKKSTGLRWDPVSIADYVALFAQCNALRFFKPLELRHDIPAKKLMSHKQNFRLGYWDKIVRGDETNTEVVYGIGVYYSGEDEANVLPTHTDPTERIATHGRLNPLPMHDHTGQKCAEGKWPFCEHYPYRRSPGVSLLEILGFTIITWAALGGLIALFVYRKVFDGFEWPNDWHVPGGFPTVYLGDKKITPPPFDPMDPNSTLLVYALLFRSLPTYVATIYVNWIIESIDLNMRFMQPFRNMFGEPGEASDTILLAYLTLSSLQVPLTALHKGHWAVLIYSTINTLSPLFPIFVGALISISGNANFVNFSFSLSATIGTLFSLVVFSVAIPYTYPFPHRGRLLPREFFSMADLMAMCYDARFMAGPNFNISPSKTPTKDVFEARILLSGEKFLFGRYVGRQDELHLGFDCRDYRGANYGELHETDCVEWLRPYSKFGLLPSVRNQAILAARATASATHAIRDAAVNATGVDHRPESSHLFSHLRHRQRLHERHASEGRGRSTEAVETIEMAAVRHPEPTSRPVVDPHPVGLGVMNDDFRYPAPSPYRHH